MQRYLSRVQSIFTDKKKCVFPIIFFERAQKRSNLPHGLLLLTALAIIQRLKPRKFKDVHLNKSPMSSLNNDRVSRLVVSQIVGQNYIYDLRLRITCNNVIVYFIFFTLNFVPKMASRETSSPLAFF